MLFDDPLNADLSMKATRDGYGQGLADAGKTNEKIVVLDADLSGSTKTNIFAKEFPKRFYNFGVAEQNLMGQAAGLAISGLIPVASSFAMFAAGRAWEIVRNSIAYPKLNVKIAATHAGITLGEDGASHQIIEDLALMRVIPDMTVLVPADYWQAYHAIQAALKYHGPVYIRLGRPNIPQIYTQSDSFEIGKAKVIQQGNKITFIAIGIMVYEAWKAAALLEKQIGHKITVIDAGTVKPLDSKTILEQSKSSDIIFTFEEHNVAAGFGSAVAELICASAQPKRVVRLGIDDVFGQSGTIEALMKHYQLTAEKLVERILPFLA